MILLTGSSGYIGSHISHILEKNKIKYIGIDNLSKSSINNIVNKKRFLKLDYGNENKMKKLLANNSISSVIHCAAYAYVLESERKKKMYFNNNVQQTKKLINQCIKKKIQNFIFLSSSNVYKDSNKKKIENSNIKISNIKNNYGNENKTTKLFANNSVSSVIHCAAYAYVLEGERKKKIYFNNNVNQTKKFINECIKKKIQNFIFLSSSNVYKDSNKKKIENSKIKISHIKNKYGKTKFLIEKFLISKKKNFKNLIILRLFNIAGYTDDLKYTERKIDKNLRIFPLIFKRILKKKNNNYLC